MKNRIIAVFALITFSTTMSGCTSLKGNVPFQYQPSLISVEKKINKSVGFNIVKDERSEKAIKSMERSIKDVPNKVTYKMMEDFKSSGIFEEVHFPPQSGDDIVINGTLQEFSWKVGTNWFAVLTYLMYFGMPVETHIGNVALSLEIVDKKTGEVLGVVEGSGSQKLSYSLYNMSVGETGSELAEAFRLAVKELKEKTIEKVDF